MAELAIPKQPAIRANAVASGKPCEGDINGFVIDRKITCRSELGGNCAGVFFKAGYQFRCNGLLQLARHGVSIDAAQCGILKRICAWFVWCHFTSFDRRMGPNGNPVGEGLGRQNAGRKTGTSPP